MERGTALLGWFKRILSLTNLYWPSLWLLKTAQDLGFHYCTLDAKLSNPKASEGYSHSTQLWGCWKIELFAHFCLRLNSRSTLHDCKPKGCLDCFQLLTIISLHIIILSLFYRDITIRLIPKSHYNLNPLRSHHRTTCLDTFWVRNYSCPRISNRSIFLFALPSICCHSFCRKQCRVDCRCPKLPGHCWTTTQIYHLLWIRCRAL